ncbi:pyridoxal phosphate-dependent aminotransferase [Anaerotignum sp. MSJ-24]|uniref:pyridoxal phosphate-dependent aminotransferase n=1 Tax=Anaerotignum sp. MSJ-24 TaxID=2841521 RepID=UPI001C108540|nr:pyridoxal phosphate-dependent aminotransferase [Anaerotignum sp. MSJ-24]MBU5465019.1 pyridoxal phosphate-dependent aminotransferase [Anaerotignum sp. MSJ-24]
MISDQMLKLVNGSSAIRAMFEEGKKLAAIYGAENVYDYSLGNPSVEPPLEVKKAIYHILETEEPNLIHGYPNNSGFEDVRQAVAEHLNKKFGTAFSFENIVMTNGAAAALNIIFKCILNPGDEIITFAPFFTEYRNYAANYNATLTVVPANLETFEVNFDEFEKLITPRTRGVLINTPNNPSGVVYSEETIKKIAAVMEKKQAEFGTDIYLISDEPYRELVYENIEVPYVSKYYKNTFVAYSFSKSLSLPGERIGYLVANSEMADFEKMMYALNVANRVCGFVNANSLFQRVVPYCLDCKVDIEIYNRNRIDLYNKLTELGFKCVKPVGAFYMFPETPIEDDVAFCNAAKEFNLLLVPGSGFGCKGHMRLSYCVSHDTIINSFPAFEKLAAKFIK